MPAAPTLILRPFANTGDKATVPQTDPSSFVNFETGYTPDYEINLAAGNPAAKAVERPVQNWLFNLLTSNVQQYQQYGMPQWYNSMPGGYDKNALVLRLAADAVTLVPYRSLVVNNVSDPLSSPLSWEYVPYGHEMLANIPMPSGGAQGSANIIINAAKDFNTAGTGTWNVASDAVAQICPNCPAVIGSSAVAGMLMSMHWVAGGNNFDAQIYMARDAQIFVRGATNGSWANWRQLFAAPNVYVVGEIRIWSGTATESAVQAAWGPYFHLCNGLNGTRDLTNRMVLGAGNGSTTGQTGGTANQTLTTAHLPNHSHVINVSDPGHTHAISQSPHGHSISDPGHSHAIYDPGHNHGVNDPGHNHGVNDPGHSHGMPNLGSVQAGADNGGAQCPVNTGYSSGRPQQGVNGSGTGIFLSASGTGIFLNASATGIATYGSGTGVSVVPQVANVSNVAAATGITASSVATGGGGAFSILNPYMALAFVQYTGA